MIQGTISSRNEITIPIQVRDSAGALHGFEPILDTGFSGALTLTSAAIAYLRLPLSHVSDWLWRMARHKQ
jgi:predicted aspartyl protease